MFLLSAFVLVVFLEGVRRQRNETLVLAYQYRLFALRDELREHAMHNAGAAKSWVFPYLDSTIARSIALMPEMSIWHLLALWAAHRNDPSLETLKKHLQKEFSKGHNEKFKEIEEKLITTLGEFILSRHILMVVMSFVTLLAPVAIVQAMDKMKRRSLELVVESPATSTLGEFAPAT